MRKFSCLALLLFFCWLDAGAQEYYKGQLFGGYSYLHAGTHGSTNGNIPAGGSLEGTRHLFRGLGITGSFEAHHKNHYGPGEAAYVWAALGGPQYRLRFGKFEPFAHALEGTTRVGLIYADKVPPQGSPTDSRFAWSTKFGGGLDVAVSNNWVVRIAELNFYRTRFAEGKGFDNIGAPETAVGFHQNNFTFSTGVVLRWRFWGRW